MTVWKVATFLLLVGFVQGIFAQNVTDKLIVTLVDQHLPQALYEEKAQAWQMGTYDLRVNRTTAVSFNSTATDLNLTVPIEVLMVGQVNREFLGQKIRLNCTSSIQTAAKLQVKPFINPPLSKVKVEVSVPIPASNLNCDGLILPIQGVLEQLVANKKLEWENQLEQEILLLFKQVGI